MIENTKTNKEATSMTLIIDGSEAVKAITTSFIPSSLEMTLNGLKHLKALRAFSA